MAPPSSETDAGTVEAAAPRRLTLLVMSDESPGRHAEPVVVAGYPDRGEAEVTVAHLRANGIESFVIDEIGDTLPVSFEGGVCVAVHAEDAEVARQVLGIEEAD
jgi:hypothetical protein